MTTNQIKTKHGRKPQYPDYISLDILDSVIKSGADPMEMIAQMKKALMERVMEAELDHHLEHDKNARTIDGNYRNGYGTKNVLMDDGEIAINTPRDRD
jgi:putative transposase